MPDRKTRPHNARPDVRAAKLSGRDETTAHSVAGIMRGIAFGLLLLAAGLGPLAPSMEISFALRLIINTLFVTAGAVFLLAMTLEGRIRLRKTGMGLWLLFFCAAIVCSVIIASNRYQAALTAFGWLSGMLGFVIVLHTGESRRARFLLLFVLSASALVVCLHGLHQLAVELPELREQFMQNPESVLRNTKLPPNMAYDFEGRLQKTRIFSTFILPTSLAGFIILMLPVFLGLFLDALRNKEKRRRILPLILKGTLFLPILLALLFTRSSGGLLAFIVSMIAFLLWTFKDKLAKRRMGILCGVLILLVILVIAQACGLLTAILNITGDSSSLGIRYGYWRAGLEIFRQHKLFGVGLDNFSDYYASFKLPTEQETHNAHNDYVQIAVEMGLIGLVMYMALWLRFWRKALREEQESPLPDPDKPFLKLPHAAGIVLLSLCVFSLETSCSQVLGAGRGASGLAWSAILLLCWNAFFFINARYRPSGPDTHSFTTIGIGCGLIAFLTHSLVDFDRYVGGIDHTAWLMMGLFLTSRLSNERKSYLVDRFIAGPARVTIALATTGLALALLYLFVQPLIEAKNLQEQATAPTESISLENRSLLLEKAIKINPWDPSNYALLSDAYLYAWKSRPPPTANAADILSEAVKNAQAAIARARARAEYYTRLGRLYEQQWLSESNAADYKMALAAYENAEKRFASNPMMHLHLARLHDRAGEYQLALGKYRRALALSKNQYHDKTRRFTEKEHAEIRARISQLKNAMGAATPPPPLHFDEPTLLGWPPDYDSSRHAPSKGVSHRAAPAPLHRTTRLRFPKPSPVSASWGNSSNCYLDDGLWVALV